MVSVFCSFLPVLALLWPFCTPLNLVLPPGEVEKLLGVQRELAYIRHDVINHNAAKFLLPIPEELNAIQFLWWEEQNDVEYRIFINSHSASGDPEEVSAMYQPHLNISHTGRVPRDREIFKISLPCTGRLDAVVQVDITLQFNISGGDSFQVNLIREKTCTADYGKSSVSTASSPYDRSHDVQPHIVFYATLLSALATVICTAICIGIVHVKGSLHKILKDGGGGQPKLGKSNKSTFNTIVSSKTNNDHVHSYEPVFQTQQNPLGYNEGLLTMDPRVGGPLPPPENPPPPPPPTLPILGKQKFEFMSTGFPSDAESRVTDWVNQQQGMLGGPAVAAPEPSSIQDQEDELLIAEAIFQSLQVDRQRLKLGSLLQEGTFGRVYQGLFQVKKTHDEEIEDMSDTESEIEVNKGFEDEDIMVKTVLTGSSESQSQLLVQESVKLLWNRKSSLSNASKSNNTGNKHILTPLAGTWDGTSPMVIYPYPSHGNLKQYLTKFASAGLSTHQVVRLGVQMISALAHLHKKKIIHKDVSTRNCFLSDGQNILLGDASLSRDLFPADYHCLGDNENRPIKWMPIEAISGKHYSKASDVWSFGVFLWELMTKAQQPFADIDPFEMESYLNEGYRLHQPMNCPDQLYSVLAACWATLPQERANIQSLHSTLQWMQKQLQQFV